MLQKNIALKGFEKVVTIRKQLNPQKEVGIFRIQFRKVPQRMSRVKDDKEVF